MEEKRQEKSEQRYVDILSNGGGEGTTQHIAPGPLAD